jgi:hypothetical protein
MATPYTAIRTGVPLNELGVATLAGAEYTGMSTVPAGQIKYAEKR